MSRDDEADRRGRGSREAELARHREVFRRFAIVHFLAYLPATLVAIALLPSRLDGAIASGIEPSDARAAIGLVLRSTAPVFAVTWIASHLLGARWIVSVESQGRAVALGAPIVVALASALAAAVTWSAFLSG
jgi:hypothetical protein